MTKMEILEKIREKKGLNKIPLEDVEMAFSFFERRQTSDEEKIKLTRKLLHSAYGAFGSKKLLSPKNKEATWILRKHISTRERLPHYSKIYKRIFFESKGKISIFDLGCGVNGFSYPYFSELNLKAKYFGVEGVGQLVDLMNDYFKKEKFNAKAVHLSLFKINDLKNLIKKEKGPKVIFLFKVLDSLEMLKRDYSKELLLEIASLVDKVVVSFATESFNKRTKFKAKRYWIKDFIQERFKIVDDFELGGEEYIIFQNK